MYLYMPNMYLINESIINNFQTISLYVTTTASVTAGILVIVSKNPIVSVLFLIGLFLSVASFLMLQGLNFIGLAYLLVYVGAVSILFLFILMLINVRISEITSYTSNSVPLGILVGTILYTIISKSFPNQSFSPSNLVNSNSILNLENINKITYENPIFFNITTNFECNPISAPAWDSLLTDFSHISVIGNVLYIVFPLWLILTSIVLLLAMVGTIVITIKGN